VRFVAGLSLVIRAFEDVYGNLEGRRLEALARLFAQNVRIYVYPMTATDLREWLQSVSITGWEWSETNGWVLQANCAARRLSDIYSLISSPATFLSLCESLYPSCSVHVTMGCSCGV
jgi:hypothetical protein